MSPPPVPSVLPRPATADARPGGLRPSGAGLDCRGRWLPLPPGRAVVMGVLNVTPDSFSDGGQYPSVQAALDRAGAMAGEGAALIDVGGESTRPAGAAYGAGAQTVRLDDELARVVPVVEAIARHLPHVLISVDTQKGAVAREALRAGAHVVNDITGLRLGVGTARAAADFGAPLVVMHGAGATGQTAHEATPDDDVVEAVLASLAQSVRRAEAEGVRDVVVDPGFGFGKAPADNLRLVDAVDRLAALGRPVLVGVSRKASVGVAIGRTGAPPADRLFGGLGLAALAAVRGAAIVRTHDVAPTVDVLRAVAAALDATADAARRSGASA